ncbi:MAG: tyrosine recombinase [Spirochaetaceae bacterium]|nr:MAG: tyrosine recombinase [Spirochaetaceae bacterium]
MLERYLQYLSHVRHLSANTLSSYRRDLESYFSFLSDRNWTEADMDAGRARSFVGHLSRRGLSSRSINRILSALRGYYRFLERIGAQAGNPFASIKSLKADGKLPTFLFEEEIERLLTGEPEDLWQLRDLLILELLYSTGCRVSELASASLKDLDLKNATLRVLGKGHKERLVFIGQSALRCLREYLVRRKALRLTDGEGQRALLVNRRGKRLSVRGIQTIVDRLVIQSRLDKPATPHTFRHSFATHVLQQGADIRVVQELLGHASLSTTQVYTHLDMDRLREVYGAAHPHARAAQEENG